MSVFVLTAAKVQKISEAPRVVRKEFAGMLLFLTFLVHKERGVGLGGPSS
jgi:hypothetical protein